MRLGTIVNPASKKIVDQVLCCFMKGPATYTSEDMLEIHGHGGPAAASMVLETVLEAGAILAEPGEFTKRAFLGGRIDLAEAEAVADLIGARARIEAEYAVSHLTGEFSSKIQAIRASIIMIAAQLEVCIDYPEEELDVLQPVSAMRHIQDECIAPIDELLALYEGGRLFKEGVKAAIIGRPNVGKSSLLNALIHSEKAIVTDLPGTTRDLIEADAVINGAPVTFVDTAGLECDPRDLVESIGQSRSLDMLQQCDIVLCVFDLSREINEKDYKLLGAAPLDRTLLVLNKMDIGENIEEAGIILTESNPPFCKISAKYREGIDDLRAAIYKLVTSGLDIEHRGNIAPNLRQKKALENSAAALGRCVDCFSSNAPNEIIAFEMNEALDHIGIITGETASEDILTEIFSRFCLGK